MLAPEYSRGLLCLNYPWSHPVLEDPQGLLAPEDSYQHLTAKIPVGLMSKLALENSWGLVTHNFINIPGVSWLLTSTDP